MSPRLRFLPRWSVRSRILASMLAVTALGMLVAGASAYLIQRERILREVDELLVARVEAARFVVTGEPIAEGDGVAAAPEAAFATDRAALEAVLARVIPGRNESALGIVDGAAAFIPGVDVDVNLSDDPAFVDRMVAETARGDVVLGTAVTPIGVLRYIAAPVDVTASPERAIYVAAVDLEGELADVTSGFVIFALVGVGALVAVGFVGWAVSGRLLRPIRRLRQTASRITLTDLHERIPVVGRDDVSELTETVNDMLGRLESSVTAQRRLLDDVRHELRTPLTIVRGHLELLDPSRPADVAATRDLVVDELDRMAGLVDDIELLTDADRSTMVMSSLDIADLTAGVYARAAVLPGHDWVLGDTAHVIVRADADRLTQAWLQLADNAAKYSPDSAPVVLGSTARGGLVELWVRDHGPGIPEDARERIFERFGRVDSGRGIRGSGLGLPIVAAIASAHGGHVSLESTSTGSRFAIVVPVAGAGSEHVDADALPEGGRP